VKEYAMISPQGPNEKYLRDVAEPVEHEPVGDRSAPSGGTVWWTVKAVAVVAAVLLTCVGVAGVVEGSQGCYGLPKRVCLALVIDHLTGKTAPVRSAD
jgi:hypothetical protein